MLPLVLGKLRNRDGVALSLPTDVSCLLYELYTGTPQTPVAGRKKLKKGS